MEKLDKARIVLREYILANKESIKKDLDEMRSKSIGKDIEWYINKIKKGGL